MLEQRKEYIKERKKEMINGRKSVVRFSNQICFESQGKQEVVFYSNVKIKNEEVNRNSEKHTFLNSDKSRRVKYDERKNSTHIYNFCTMTINFIAA